ncbi:MAG: DNA topoisomerase (ATP-hydrolyzing) [Eubacteriales bacterium]|jgi:DNA gyrase subunit A
MEEIIESEYSEIMQKSYIDYAMSVIVSRALPDVRDGLKPVQRRVLYDMIQLGTYFDRPYRKSARIVGDTMGKFHPHGDSSIYDALVVMAQDFKKEVPLVDGHGNFGSIEGDGAAAMRYTEARLQEITQEVFLKDLDKDIVNFVPNFDETEKEPEVLPVRIPSILVNGSDGIAVGMATSIPPHNLGEVADAACAFIRNKDMSTRKLMKYIKGPDFPTGGIVVNQDELEQIYETGTGKIRVRGRTVLEKGKNGRQLLVITEIPYTMIGAGIGKFLLDVADLVEKRELPEVTDISNMSGKDGIRIVLELRKGADPERVRNILYRKTKLEDTFGVNMLAVVDGRPETLSLRRIFESFTDFQFDLTTRKYQRLLEKEIEKKEIQEGLIRAVDVIDLIIEILRGSRNQQMVKDCLTMGVTDGIHFKSEKSRKQAAALCFTQRQAQAILDMRLAKLIGLEIDALYKENKETVEKIERYEKILNDYDTMADVILDDLKAIKKKYAKPRKTEITNADTPVIEEKEEEETALVFLMDRFGYARTIDPSVYLKNQEAADGENRFVFRCMSTDRICVFTDRGVMHTVKAKDLPFTKFRDKGTPLDNVCNYSTESERILFAASMEEVIRHSLVFVSARGMIKSVPGTEFNVTRKTVAATALSDDQDSVVFVGFSDDGDSLALQTTEGFFLRFPVSEIPEKKKNAIGARGIRLSQNDSVEAAYFVANRKELVIDFHGKEVTLNRLRLAKRDGRGSRVRKQEKG